MSGGFYYDREDLTIRRITNGEVVARLSYHDRDIARLFTESEFMIDEILRIWEIARSYSGTTPDQQGNLLTLIERVARRAFAKVMNLASEDPDMDLLG